VARVRFRPRLGAAGATDVRREAAGVRLAPFGGKGTFPPRLVLDDEAELSSSLRRLADRLEQVRRESAARELIRIGRGAKRITITLSDFGT
jgi:hypothetical protein